MLTTRARWILIAATTGLALSLVLRQEGMALACLVVLCWIGFEWLGFQRQITSRRDLFASLERLIGGSDRRVLTLSVNESRVVELRAVPMPRLAGLRLWIEDLVPAAFVERGTPRQVADAARKQSIAWRYQLRPTAVGRFALPGLQLTIRRLAA